MSRIWCTTVGALTTVWIVGCGGDRRNAVEAADSAEVAAAVPAAPAARRLEDAEIMHAVNAANGIDVRAGEHARTRARTPAVVAFAATMVADHNALNTSVAELARELSLTPADNAVSRQLQDDAAAALEQMDGLSGSAYEEAYVGREAEYHQAVLEALDNRLIPSAHDERLGTLLENMRPAFVAHLQRALQIRQQLGSAATSGDTVGNGAPATSAR